MWVSISVIPRPIVLGRGVTPLIAARRKPGRAPATVVSIVVKVIEVSANAVVILVAAMVVEVVKSSLGLSERRHGEGARWHWGLRARLIETATVEAWICHAEATIRGGRLAEAEYQTYQHR